MQIEGLYSGVDYSRDYPYGTLLSRFLGFTGYDAQGLAGIEYEYDKFLQANSSAIRLSQMQRVIICLMFQVLGKQEKMVPQLS